MALSLSFSNIYFTLNGFSILSGLKPFSSLNSGFFFFFVGDSSSSCFVS